MHKLLGILGAAAIFCGCGGTPSNYYDVYISNAFTDNQSHVVVMALTEWERAASPYGLRFTIHYGYAMCDSSCSNTISIHPTPKIISPDGGVAYGATQQEGDWANEWISEETTDLHQTILHETGHALGLKHSGPGTIMYPSYPSADAIDYISCADLAQYAEVRGEPVAPCGG